MSKNIQIKSTVTTPILIQHAKLKPCIRGHATAVFLTWLEWMKYLCGAAIYLFFSFTLSSEDIYVNQSLTELQSCKLSICKHNTSSTLYSLLWTYIAKANLRFISLGFLLPPKNCQAVSVRSHMLYVKAGNTPFYCAGLS